MNPSGFVAAIKRYVRDSAVDATLEQLQRPAGRKPHARLVAQSNWYNAQSKRDQEMLREIIREAADHTAFGFLCVLDGVRAIENNPKGSLVLQYLSPEGEVTVLNARELLHELYG